MVVVVKMKMIYYCYCYCCYYNYYSLVFKMRGTATTRKMLCSFSQQIPTALHHINKVDLRQEVQ